MHCFWGMVSIYNWRGFSGPLSEEGCLKQGTLPHCKFDPLDNQRQHHPPHHREVKKKTEKITNENKWVGSEPPTFFNTLKHHYRCGKVKGVPFSVLTFLPCRTGSPGLLPVTALYILFSQNKSCHKACNQQTHCAQLETARH